jgi:hypothetical protein
MKFFFQDNRFTGNLFLNRQSGVRILIGTFFPPVLIEMYFFLIQIGLYVATDYRKCRSDKIFARHISEKTNFMFCSRQTGNFKALLPVNWFTWKKQKVSVSQIYLMQKPFEFLC